MEKRRKSTKIPGFSFSAKRAFGITNAKRKIAKKTGIPTTKSGRQKKVGKAMTGGGCLVPTVMFVCIVLLIFNAI